MSEFQYYEFHSIDKPLTQKKQEEVSRMSSRVDLNSRKATFSYSYSDFRYDEEEVVIDYFDAMFYMANWGQIRMLLKFPVEIVDFSLLKGYAISSTDSYIQVYKKSGFILIDINYSEEEGVGWIEENSGNQVIGIRREIIERDYRSLFMIWLRFLEKKYNNADYEEDYKFSSALIPNQLASLNRVNYVVKDMFDVSDDWFNALVHFSGSEQEADYKKLIGKLSKEKMITFMRMILDDESNLRVKLINELRSGKGKKVNGDSEEIKLHEIGNQVAAIRTNREDKKNREAKRKQKEKMTKMKNDEDNLRLRIYDNIESGQMKYYQQAASMIVELQQMHKYFDTEEAFDKFMVGLVSKYSRRSSFKRELRRYKLID